MEFVACTPATGEVPRRRARGMADGLGRQPAADALPRRQQALHLGVGAQRLHELLPVRPDRQAASIRSRRNTTFESGAIVKLDEAAGVLFYMARDGDNYMKMQLHRVGLDGKGDVRLTDPTFNHTVGACSGGGGGGRGGGGRGRPAARRVRHLAGQQVLRRRLPDARSAAGDAARRRDERQGRRAAREERHDEVRRSSASRRPSSSPTRRPTARRRSTAQISFPSNFDPSKKYPTLVSVYGGPASGSNVPTENFAGAERDGRVRLPDRAALSSRAAPGMGKTRARLDLPEARHHRDGRHGRGHQGAVDAAVLRQGPRRHLRHVVRRLHVGDR